jgi:hypothetical protein
MLPLSGLPHCGAVSRDQTDRVERLLGKLRGEISGASGCPAAYGPPGSPAAARAWPPTAPAAAGRLVGGLCRGHEQYDYGRLVEALLQTPGGRGGRPARVVTTDRAALLGPPGTVFGQRMLLRLYRPRRCQPGGISERSLPGHQPPGRIMFQAAPDPSKRNRDAGRHPSGPRPGGGAATARRQSQDRCGRAPRVAAAPGGPFLSPHHRGRDLAANPEFCRPRRCGRWSARAGDELAGASMF